jgi:tRNA-specific 2-thiouridylase
MSRETVAVALSGGVDSSVAAYLLKELRYNVIGVHIALFETESFPGLDSAYSAEHLADDISEFCRHLSIPFHLVDLKNEFQRYVIDYFVDEYIQGRTPNPCVACNLHIKFGFLFNKLKDSGIEFNYLATGHYAAVKYYNRTYHLLTAKDKDKDQSYVLYGLDQEKLERTLFPLAEYSKKEISAIAADKQFSSAMKVSSQDICFIKNRYTEFLERFINPVPGEIIDIDGNVIGRHKGLIYYTIGQRYGLGIASSTRLYVNKIDYAANSITVGAEEHLYHKALIAGDLHWIAGEPPVQCDGIGVKIRYGMDMVTADVKINNGSAYVVFQQPQKAISPGQSVVFYNESEVLGGGIIESRAE